MDVSVIGLGKLGLSMAVAIAERGHRVIGLDILRERVEQINEGVCPINEPGLAEALPGLLAAGRLCCTTDYVEAVADSKISFVAVNTPSRPDGGMDLSQVEAAARSLGRALRDKPYHVIAVCSTVLPGTCEEMVRPLVEEESGGICGQTFGVCSNPVWVALTTVKEDYLHPPVLLIGGSDERATATLLGFYRELMGESMPVITTTPVMAEICKFSHNAFATFKMVYMNELASLCARVPGGDVSVLSRFFMAGGERPGRFLRLGLGFGGPCFPRDLHFFLDYARRMGTEPILLDAIERANHASVVEVVRIIEDALGGLEGKRLALLGLAYKPGVDIVDNSVPIVAANVLCQRGAAVTAHDPLAMENARPQLPRDVVLADSVADCLAGADAALIATPWPEFGPEIREAVWRNGAVAVFDPWGVYSDLQNALPRYHPIGVAGVAVS